VEVFHMGIGDHTTADKADLNFFCHGVLPSF
jgi:hypothetical protein